MDLMNKQENYQFNNFDKGGFGNDHTIIECPDLFAIDNANAWTGVDGDNLRIQMFPWTRYYSYDLKILDEHGAWKAMDILRFKFGLAPSSKKQQFYPTRLRKTISRGSLCL
jgi:hypothetical protein